MFIPNKEKQKIFHGKCSQRKRYFGEVHNERLPALWAYYSNIFNLFLHDAL
jgi:hypothetical protein